MEQVKDLEDRRVELPPQVTRKKPHILMFGRAYIHLRKSYHELRLSQEPAALRRISRSPEKRGRIETLVEATEVAEDWSKKEKVVAPIQKVMETEGVGPIVTKKRNISRGRLGEK